MPVDDILFCLRPKMNSSFCLPSRLVHEQYPEESVFMQQRIINRVESDPHYHQYLASFEPKHDNTAAAAIILAARQIARTVNAKAIVSFTVGGTTALRASKKRPDVPILAISPLKETTRQLALSWGVYPEFNSYNSEDFRDMLRSACEIALKKGLVSDRNDLLVVTAGFPVSLRMLLQRE